jgi:hypothetical protein
MKKQSLKLCLWYYLMRARNACFSWDSVHGFSSGERIEAFDGPALPPGILPLGAEKLVIPAEHQKPQI